MSEDDIFIRFSGGNTSIFWVMHLTGPQHTCAIVMCLHLHLDMDYFGEGEVFTLMVCKFALQMW